jgi:hypothetical protein
MDTFPDALYQNLLTDLTSYWQTEGFPWDPENPMSGPRAAACTSIANSFLKKMQVGGSDMLDSRALLKFLHVNNDCGNWTLQLSSEEDELLYGEFKRAVYEFVNEGEPCYPICMSDLKPLHYGRCGPGASLMARGGDTYTKLYASPLSCTNQSLYDEYKNYITNFPEWSIAEKIRADHYGEAHVVAGNRLSFVPKDSRISRVICTEPSLNMFYQLGFGHIIERRLQKAYGISMAQQPTKNRELARLGSLTNDIITIDLSSASDSMSMRMLASVLPHDFFMWLDRYRSPLSLIPGLGYTELNMVSTMGNGFTFPLQTMLFSCIVVAASRVVGCKLYFPRGREHGNWGVFGDDIACPIEISGQVHRLLDILGFTVNSDKSFVEGPFRESCGHDYFKGRNIRGVYLKEVDTVQDRFAVINQLNLFSTRTGIPLPKTVQALVHSVPWTPVPVWENDDAGIKVPLSLAGNLPVSKRYQSVLYTCYRVAGKKLRIGDSAIFSPKSSKSRIYNPSGLLLCFLQQSVNAYSIGVRHDPPRYKRKQGVAPSWDYLPTIPPSQGGFDWQRWNTAVYFNLYG